jgi:N-acetylglucosaminyldiphosphoundecaprenol N-acetyl-beta-D-mannosaminyltransferase
MLLDRTDRVEVWGLPLARLDYAQTLDAIDELVARREPAFFVTANLHYAMLTRQDPRLRAVNQRAAFLVADGMPLVWYSRLTAKPLPQRVAGADLIYLLAERAAKRGHRLFLLGGAPGVAEQAAAVLRGLYPALVIAGIEAPTLETLSTFEHDALVERIRRSQADLLLVALGQPKGELWLAENYERLGVPASVQLGATFDFVDGRVRRAPRRLQKVGLEWLYRLMSDPRRLAPRYLKNGVFLVRAVLGDLRDRLSPRQRGQSPTNLRSVPGDHA